MDLPLPWMVAAMSDDIEDDRSEVVRAYYRRYGTRIYNPDANEAALEERRRLAEQRRLYPPTRPPRASY